MRRFLTALAAIAAFGLSACAPLMPLAEDNAKVDASKPLYLISVVVKNDYKKRWQPRVLNVILADEPGSARPEPAVFRMDKKGRIESDGEDGDDDKTTFLVRFTTGRMPTVLRGFNTQGSAFPVHGFYFVPLHASVPSAQGGVHYLGAVRATVRERQGDEFRAGPLIPLIDQAVAGASTGTFDVVIDDAYAADMELFRSAFPALRGVEVRKALLAPWDRAKAQAYWEKN